MTPANNFQAIGPGPISDRQGACGPGNPGHGGRENMENARSESNPPREVPRTIPDEALLRRAQQGNQAQILSKLLHDLRNPIHSIRITMELFGRLARRTGNVDELIERAAVYIGPAEAAMNRLCANTERLAGWLANPTMPAVAALGVREWFEEVALLLRASRRRLNVTVAVTDPALRMLADRPRLGHGVLQCCLANESSHATLLAREENDDRVAVEIRFGAPGETLSGERSGEQGAALNAEELRELFSNAGGVLVTHDPTCVLLSFRRSAP